ncbi:MAG: rhodanese-like domain-containing protein [Haliscomenobacter sp.]
MNNDISVRELKEKIDRGESFILIDVREPDEHLRFNIGGQLIPLGTVPNTIDDMDYPPDTEIIVYCRSGRRSATARHLMTEAGFRNVRNLKGGVLEWIELFHQ